MPAVVGWIRKDHLMKHIYDYHVHTIGAKTIQTREKIFKIPNIRIQQKPNLYQTTQEVRSIPYIYIYIYMVYNFSWEGEWHTDFWLLFCINPAGYLLHPAQRQSHWSKLMAKFQGWRAIHMSVFRFAATGPLLPQI